MPFCRHCGRPTEGAGFCPACGSPIASDAVGPMAARSPAPASTINDAPHRGLPRPGPHRIRGAAPRPAVIRLERAVAAGYPSETSAPAPSQPPLPPQTPPCQAHRPDTFPDKSHVLSTAQPQQPIAAGGHSRRQQPDLHPSTGSIDPQAGASALNILAPHSRASRTGRPSPNPAAGAAVPPAPTVIPAPSPSRSRRQTSPTSASPLPARSIPRPTRSRPSSLTTANSTRTPKSRK